MFLLAHQALECSSLEEQRQVVLSSLRRIIDYDGAVYWLAREPDYIDLDDFFGLDIEVNALTPYRQYYCRIDPFFTSTPHKAFFPPKGTALSNEQIVPADEWRSCEYYNDFLARYDIAHELFIYLVYQQRAVGLITLERSKKSPAFSHGEIAAAGLVAPHLACALDVCLSSGLALTKDQLIKDILAKHNIGPALVFDESLRPIYCDKQAEKIISRLWNRQTKGDTFFHHLPNDTVVFCRNLLESARRVGGFSPQRIKIINNLDAEDQEIPVTLMCVAFMNDNYGLIVQVDNLDPIASLSARLNCYHLSQRELEVIDMVSKGLKNSEISSKLCISVRTVEVHLTNIYRKVKVRNRAGLMKTLISGYQ